MQKLLVSVLLFMVAGCVTLPRNEVIKPPPVVNTVCVEVKLNRFREGPISREIEKFPLEKGVEASYRQSLKKFGIETECGNPVTRFEFDYTIRGGMKIPSFDLLLTSVTVLTAGIIPSYSEMIVDLSYTRDNAKSVNYLVQADQWISLFLIPKESKQQRESRNVYGVSNYWDAMIVGKTAEIILKELQGGAIKEASVGH
ncbi:hypothetical protein ACLVWU_08565 [Bdellovibrio sp. HCB290]|uniref:hypothetical protein n=1 Tax=Bdellovibrio sp. HCB290 TaxID=3394356 RepID=UPI0039B60F62